MAAAATFLPRITKTLSSLGLINSYDEKDEFSLSEFAGTTHNASTDQNPPIDSKTKWISSFIELLPDPVALVSKSGNVFHVNKKFCLALKASAPTLLKDCNLLDLLHDRDRHKVLAGLDKCYILKDVVELIQVRCCTLGKLTSNYFECSLLLSSHGDDNMILVVLRR